MTTYLGYDVFTAMPNRREDPDETWRRGASRLGASPGMYAVHDPIAKTARGRTVVWTLFTPDAIDEAEAFLEARQGRKHPFWLPTWHRDLTLAAGASSGASSLSITDVGYAANLFPLLHRRHLAVIRSAVSVECVKVTNAVDAGSTETLTLSGTLGSAVTTSAMLSHLLFCRLASDEQTIVYHARRDDANGRALAELTFDVVELPREVP